MNILLVEDELKVADFIRKGLKEQLYDVTVAYDGLTGERLALENDYDVVVMDVILPQRNGLEVCKELRRLKPELPVLLLTALGTMQDKMAGFDCGADDYLVKPFHFEELIARLRVLTRRKTLIAPGTIYRVADLEVDGYKKKVTRNKKEIQLTAKEFALLEVLVIHKNRVLSRTKIAEMVWGIDFNRGTNLIDVYINYLRSKIDKGFEQQLIHTVIGMGYTLKEP
ncbi:DNA-binding response regulator, OmpR family, contains REC and winged-helix (wHTH) domain [Hydrobacter penzbergensis]|jgi:two-component system copper resistance phosphate regulon response regulator CusR|uniref:DNA-binding response regulator, OmpR family, contains REC and winged-helix (WHTH) domain n=1 Tax=Hydrobacter penzbergensis TaxID=1235997 RepID=A0A8X8LEM5_9BACT|nr:response regulator [Hydrobacter penzbergensis]MBN8720775.1 response regulator [Sediminibacterium magnilacihabitans]PQV59362.1 DNA-binding response OmpR family regulator [Sediminibacterium magnilacihabitans]SDX04478.1 DNA-binding response regulator, OmpR family, contains REC and winged-helix (wHTH) domain [Hydrobacter penzbergensis]